MFTFFCEEFGSVRVALLEEILKLLPIGGTEAFGQPMEVGGRQLEWLIAQGQSAGIVSLLCIEVM